MFSVLSWATIVDFDRTLLVAEEAATVPPIRIELLTKCAMKSLIALPVTLFRINTTK
jgi:hypothetical protein